MDGISEKCVQNSGQSPGWNAESLGRSEAISGASDAAYCVFWPLEWQNEQRQELSGYTCCRKWLMQPLHGDILNLGEQQDVLHKSFTQTWGCSEFYNQWIGRGGPRVWPPRLQNLAPIDYFFWALVTDNRYISALPVILEEIRTRITEANAISDHDTSKRGAGDWISASHCYSHSWPSNLTSLFFLNTSWFDF
jgi:hypothetical protein